MRKIEIVTSTTGNKRIFIDNQDCTPEGTWLDTRDLLIQALTDQGIEITHYDSRGRVSHMARNPI